MSVNTVLIKCVGSAHYFFNFQFNLIRTYDLMPQVFISSQITDYN